MTMIDDQLHKNFVAPNYCQDLLHAGFATQPLFTWKIENHVTKLQTFIFDDDDYYKLAEAATDFVSPGSKVILPAYTLMDVAAPFNDYFISVSAAGFEIGLHKIYNLEICKAARMPDAFALLLLQAIKKRLIQPHFLNQST